jgi:hypothetical protein
MYNVLRSKEQKSGKRDQYKAAMKIETGTETHDVAPLEMSCGSVVVG